MSYGKRGSRVFVHEKVLRSGDTIRNVYEIFIPVGKNRKRAELVRAKIETILPLVLQSRPLGFTGEDVRTLRMHSAMFDGERNGNFASIADRIEALLPPVKQP